jgi:inorganic pyrophosphatase
MIEVFVEVEAGSCDRHLYDEKNFEYKGKRQISHPYPYPYGFILGTTTADGGGVDSYIITKDRLKSGTIVTCEPIGLLEMIEDGEIDHKVLVTVPGQNVAIDHRLHDVLRTFIQNIFAQLPETCVEVGRILPKQAAIDHIRQFRGGNKPNGL